MADLNIGVSISRSDQRDVAYGGSVVTPDVNDLERIDKVIPAGDGTTAYTLWTSSADGSAISADPFNVLTLILDPDFTVTDAEQDIGVWVIVYTTLTAGGASSAETNYVRLTRRAPMILPSARRGTSTAGGKWVTKIAVKNDDATNNLPVRILVQ